MLDKCKVSSWYERPSYFSLSLSLSLSPTRVRYFLYPFLPLFHLLEVGRCIHTHSTYFTNVVVVYLLLHNTIPT